VRGLAIIVTAVLALLAPQLAGAAPGARLALQPADLPGWRAAPVPRAFVAGLPRVARPGGDVRGAAQGTTRVAAWAARTPRAGTARAALRRWARGRATRPLALADGARVAGRGRSVTVALRAGRAVAVVQVSARAPVARTRALAILLARVQAERLRRPARPTAFARLEAAGRRDGRLDRRTAMRRLALVYGPGGAAVSGSSLIDGLRGVWPRLGPADRREVRRALRATAPRGVRRDAEAGPLDPATGCRTSLAGLPLDRAVIPEATALRDAIAARLPTFRGTWRICAYDALSRGALLADTVWGTAGDRTSPWNATPVDITFGLPRLDTCMLRLYDGLRDLSPANRRTLIGHEMYHCLTQEWRARTRTAFPPRIAEPNPQWAEDGLATWTGNQVAPGTYAPAGQAPGLYHQGWLTGRAPFFAREYTMFGFLGLVEERGGAAALFARIEDAWRAEDDSAAVFDILTGSNQPEILRDMGPAQAREPGLPAPWAQRLPYDVSDLVSRSPRATLVAAPQAQAVVGPHDLALYDIWSPLRPLVEVTIRGRGRLTDGVGDWPDPEGLLFCLRGSCACPAGTEATDPLRAARPAGRLLAGVGAGRSPSVIVIRSRDPRELCRRTAGPAPAGGPAGRGAPPGRGGTSNGDPHLTTFDGLRYDFQAVGEFVLARGGDGFEVQARQAPLPGSRLASINTQLGMRVGRSRVTIAAASPPLVRVDGRPADARRERALAGGGSVGPARDEESCIGVVVRWADGSFACTWSVGRSGVAVRLVPAAARRGALSGLLGDSDGEPADDLRTRAGEVLDPVRAPGSRTLLYRRLGDSWRIRPGESLLDYAPGESTRTFTDRTFPRRLFALDDLTPARRARAEARCRAAGVVEEDLLEDCILDVALSGDDDFARSAAAAEDAVAAVPWRELAGLGDLRRRPSVAPSGDGGLAIALARVPRDAGRPSDRAVTVIGPDGTQGPVEAIGPEVRVPDEPLLVPGVPLRLVAQTGFWAPPPPGLAVRGVVRWTRGPGGWTAADLVPGEIAGSATAYAETPDGTPWTLLVDSSSAGFAVRRGTDATVPAARPAVGPSCLATNANLVADGARVWAAWLEWDCADPAADGWRTAALDPATGAVGPPARVPLPAGAREVFETGGPPAALVARPGGGAWMVVAAEVGGVRRAFLHRLGEPGSADVGPVAPRFPRVDLAATASGRLWLTWFDETAARRTVLRARRVAPGGATMQPGVVSALLPGGGEEAARLGDLRVAARGEDLDLVAFRTASGEQPARVWHVRLPGG
jgi:hypothetical protein